MSDDIEKPNNDNVLDKVNTDDPEDDTSEKAKKMFKPLTPTKIRVRGDRFQQTISDYQ